MDYYGIGPSSDFFAHYGVKGMKWGVRRALKNGNKNKLYKQWKKANNKYEKLIQKTDIPKSANDAYAHRALARGAAGVTGIQGGLSAALIAKEGLKKSLPLASFFTGPAAALTGVAATNYLINKKRLTSKGHKKAVQKVKNWESEMKKAFKDTNYRNFLNDDSHNFKDEYIIQDLVKGKDGYKEKTVAKIKGSHLTTDYKGKDKKKFMKMVSTPVNRLKIDKKTGMPSVYDRNIVTNLNSVYYEKEHDPMSFNYNYHSLTRKRKDKKLPWYMSSKDSYNNYKRGSRS